MPDATQTPAVRRFGTFEINLQSGELRKNGMRLRLSGQPFQVLAILVERPGEVVTREELHSKLWPVDTFVDQLRSLRQLRSRKSAPRMRPLVQVLRAPRFYLPKGDLLLPARRRCSAQ